MVKDYPICVKNNKTMDIHFVICITKKFMYINLYINAQEIPGEGSSRLAIQDGG